MKPLFAFFLVILFCPPTSYASGKVALAWEASPDPSIVGYAIYYVKAGGSTNSADRKDVGASTSAVVNGLDMNVQSYYFYVVGYNASGIESRPSNAVTGEPEDENLPPGVSAFESFMAKAFVQEKCPSVYDQFKYNTLSSVLKAIFTRQSETEKRSEWISRLNQTMERKGGSGYTLKWIDQDADQNLNGIRPMSYANFYYVLNAKGTAVLKFFLTNASNGFGCIELK